MDLPGNQTVTFVTVTPGARDRNNMPTSPTRTPVDVDGCMFRPLSISEKVGMTDMSTDIWKCTAPPVSAALAANAQGQIDYQGATYQVTGGAQREYDLDGVLDHVTVLCQRQTA